MNEMIMAALNIINTKGFALAQCVVLSVTAWNLLHRRKSKRQAALILLITTLVTFILLQISFGIYQNLKLFSIIFLTILIWRFTFSNSLGEIVFFSIIVFYELMLSDLIVGNITAFLLDGNILKHMYDNEYLRFLVSIISLIVYCGLLYFTYRYFNKNHLDTETKYWMAVDVILGFCFSISLLFMNFNAAVNEKNLSITALVVWFSFAVVSILIIKLFSDLCFYFQNEKHETVLRLKNSALEDLVSEQRGSLEAMQLYRHDVKHRMSMIAYQLGELLTPELKKLLDSSVTDLEIEKVCYCENSDISAIINLKKMQCKKNKIEFKICLDSSYNTNMQSADIITLLSNLLDNAIEAVIQLPEEQKKIELQIGKYKAYDCFSVRNTYAILQRNMDGNFITTKSDKSLHGYGLKSIQEIAGRYHGRLNVVTDNNIFVATAFLKQ